MANVSEFLEQRFNNCAVDVLDAIYDSGSQKLRRAETPRDEKLISLFGNLRATVGEIPPEVAVQLQALHEADALEDILYPAIRALLRDPSEQPIISATEFLTPLITSQREPTRFQK